MGRRLAAVTVLLLAGCNGPTASSASAIESPALESPAGADEWGPLAVLRLDPTGSDLAAAEGQLSISDECVVLDGMTLVWADSQTTWDDARNLVVFSDPNARVDVELTAGDRIRIGGGEVGDPPAFPWVAAPDPSCPPAWFAVGFIVSVNGQAVGD